MGNMTIVLYIYNVTQYYVVFIIVPIPIGRSMLGRLDIDWRITTDDWHGFSFIFVQGSPSEYS